MATKSKFFRIATEGATTDGRTITRDWIEQMARNYDPQKYGARINLEHIRGIVPDGPFKAYGDVVALKTEKGDDGKLHLLAQIDPTPDLIDLSKKRQKVYTSAEVAPDFAKTGEAYLVGLAVTDSPASLGTEMLQFAAKATVNPLATRKQDAANVFTESVEVELAFEEDTATSPATFNFSITGNDSESFLTRLTSLFKGGGKETEATPAAAAPAASDPALITQAMQLFASQMSEQFNAAAARLNQAITDAIKPVTETQTQLRADLDTLTQQLSSQDAGQTRAAATGSNGALTTDC